MGSCCSSLKVEERTVPQKDTSLATGHLNASYLSFNSYYTLNERPTICNWQFLDIIGRGSLSRVYLAKNADDNKMAAAKIYNIDQIGKKGLKTSENELLIYEEEIKIMASISHRYLLSIIDAIEDDNTRSIMLFTPFAQMGSVQALFDEKKLNRTMILTCFHQVAIGLAFLHSKNIVHRDIKPENFLCFTETYYCVADFSCARILKRDDEMLLDTKGSPAFLSPEECTENPFYPKPSDVWSYGIALYSCLYGSLPYNINNAQSSNVANAVLLIAEHLIREELSLNNDPEFQIQNSLLQNILQKDPHSRPEFKDIVLHPLFDEVREIDEINRFEDEESQPEE